MAAGHVKDTLHYGATRQLEHSGKVKAVRIERVASVKAVTDTSRKFQLEGAFNGSYERTRMLEGGVEIKKTK